MKGFSSRIHSCFKVLIEFVIHLLNKLFNYFTVIVYLNFGINIFLRRQIDNIHGYFIFFKSCNFRSHCHL